MHQRLGAIFMPKDKWKIINENKYLNEDMEFRIWSAFYTWRCRLHIISSPRSWIRILSFIHPIEESWQLFRDEVMEKLFTKVQITSFKKKYLSYLFLLIPMWNIVFEREYAETRLQEELFGQTALILPRQTAREHMKFQKVLNLLWTHAI